MLEKSGLSVRRACKILGINRTTFLYEKKEKKDAEILAKMKKIIKKQPKAGCNMITMLLHQDGIKINHKRVERLYKENKIQLKNQKKKRKKYSVKKRDEHILTEKPEKWLAVDFVIDSIATDNCFVESFNRVFREECLNENYFESLSEAKRIIESWRIDYNENRPQKGLKGLTPNQFKTKLKSTKNSL